MQIQGNASEGHIKLYITYPRVPNLTYNFKATITVHLQQSNPNSGALLSKTIFTPQTRVSVGAFEGGKIYKVTFEAVIGGREYNKTIFVFVGSWGQQSQQDQEQNQRIIPGPRPHTANPLSAVDIRSAAKESSAFSHSEDLMKMVGKSVGITNEKTLDRFILKGRNCRNTREFVGKGNSDCLKKKEMLIKGKIILKDVYKQKEGMQFFKNDWFMGPFYSYNHNEKKMAQGSLD